MQSFICERCGKQEVNSVASGHVRIRTREYDNEYELCSACTESLSKQLKSDKAKVYDKILGRC